MEIAIAFMVIWALSILLAKVGAHADDTEPNPWDD